MRHELLFRGPLTISGETSNAEVWVAEGAAVAFADGVQLSALRDVSTSLTDDGRLLVSGTALDGEPLSWVGAEPARQVGRWVSASIAWPTGERWRGATVVWTQYAVVVTAPGGLRRELVGARTEMAGVQRWIVHGTERILADADRRGCGCGGRRN